MKIIIPSLFNIKEDFSLKKKDYVELVTQVIETATDSIFNEWRNVAGKELNSTRKDYLRGLFKPEYEVNGDVIKGVIALTGTLANMIESGAPVFDIKAGMQKAKNVKRSRDGGWYMSINFRFATPKALGEDSAFSNVLPKSVYDVAKHLKPTWTDLQKQKYGFGESLKKQDVPKPFDEVKTRKGYGTFGEYTHKNSIYDGMIRQQKTYEKATQSTYSTFRRISSKSDPNSWIHPGFIAKNFAEKAVAGVNLDLVVEKATINFLQGLGF